MGLWESACELGLLLRLLVAPHKSGLNATSVAEAALCALLAMAKNLAGQAVAFEERRPGVGAVRPIRSQILAR